MTEIEKQTLTREQQVQRQESRQPRAGSQHRPRHSHLDHRSFGPGGPVARLSLRPAQLFSILSLETRRYHSLRKSTETYQLPVCSLKIKLCSVFVVVVVVVVAAAVFVLRTGALLRMSDHVFFFFSPSPFFHWCRILCNAGLLISLKWL